MRFLWLYCWSWNSLFTFLIWLGFFNFFIIIYREVSLEWMLEPLALVFLCTLLLLSFVSDYSCSEDLWVFLEMLNWEDPMDLNMFLELYFVFYGLSMFCFLLYKPMDTLKLTFKSWSLITIYSALPLLLCTYFSTNDQCSKRLMYIYVTNNEKPKVFMVILMIPRSLSQFSQMTKLIIAFIHCIFLEKIKAEKLKND